MAIAKKDEFFKIFLIATIFSVLGGIFGYTIGVYFFDFAMSIVEFYNYEQKVTDIKIALSQGAGFYTWLAILFLAGFTPLPYKVFTIASGLVSFNLLLFILISWFYRVFTNSYSFSLRDSRLLAGTWFWLFKFS